MYRTLRANSAPAAAATGSAAEAESALDDADADLAETDYAAYAAIVSLARAHLYAASGDERGPEQWVDADGTLVLRASTEMIGRP